MIDHRTENPDPGSPEGSFHLDDSVLVCAGDESSIDHIEVQDDILSCSHDGDACPTHDADGFVEVVFKGERRAYYRNMSGDPLSAGEYVITEAEKGIDLGQVTTTGSVAYLKSALRAKHCKTEFRSVLRRAEPTEVTVLEHHRRDERAAFGLCQDRIHRLQLPMKLIDVEYQFDRNRITFYFTADGRVDFRELVKELAAEFRTRIELRQIGPRDEAKRIGGFGNCGRELCCASWLGTFEPISTGMARMQNLTLNPFKLAGQCGRLKCCLAFETQVYEELLQRFPPLDSPILTTKGHGKVEKVDIFQDYVYIYHERGDLWERLTLTETQELLAHPPVPAAPVEPRPMRDRSRTPSAQTQATSSPTDPQRKKEKDGIHEAHRGPEGSKKSGARKSSPPNRGKR